LSRGSLLGSGVGSNDSKSSSDITVRLQRVEAVHSAKTDDVPGKSSEVVAATAASPGLGGKPQGRVLRLSRSGGEQSPKDGREAGSSGSPNATTGKGAPPSSASSDPGPWRIHYSGPPLSIAIACGPMSWENLAIKLSLDDDTVGSVGFSSLILRLLINDIHLVGLFEKVNEPEQRRLHGC